MKGSATMIQKLNVFRQQQKNIQTFYIQQLSTLFRSSKRTSTTNQR